MTPEQISAVKAQDEKPEYVLTWEGEIIGVKGEQTLYQKYLRIGGADFNALLTKDGEYMNLYIIDDWFIKEPLNNLDLQEPIEEYYKMSTGDKNRFIDERIVSKWLWIIYNRDYSITSEQIEELPRQ